MKRLLEIQPKVEARSTSLQPGYNFAYLDEGTKREYVASGLKAVDESLRLKPEYVEGLTYKNLLLRLKAAMEPDPTAQQALIAEALAEPGCRHYSWAADPFLPDRVHVFEEWDDEATLAAHLVAPSYFGMLKHLSGFGIAGAVTRKYRCDRVEPVYGPDGVATARFSDQGG